MPAFSHLNWDDPDVWAIVVGRGIATVEESFLAVCDAWLERNGYGTVEFSFSKGISSAVEKLGEHFRWEQQFGYRLEANSRNLDALRDGFEFEQCDVVLKLPHYERAWFEDESWARGFLAIVSEHSLHQLALGHRFFALLPVSAGESRIVGQTIESLCVPFPFRFRG